MADRAHILTDKELEKMERHLSAIYARAEKELQEKADKYFARFEELDAKKRALVDAGKMTEEEYRSWRQNKIMAGRHWTAMKEQAAQELLQANRTAQEYINARLPSVYTLNYNRTAEGVSAAVKGYSFELVDASTVKNLATSDKTLLPYKYVDGKKDVRWNTQKVNSEVLQGILQGDSIPHLAKRLQNVTEMNRASAIRNARTTVTSAENKGRMDMLHDAADKGVITHKVWMAAIDARTREAHRLLDGQEQEIDDPFESIDGDIMFPGDPEASPEMVYNCRCTLTYKVVGFGQKGEPVIVEIDNNIFSEETTEAVNRDLSRMTTEEAERWKRQIESAEYNIDVDNSGSYNKNSNIIELYPNTEGWTVIHENAHYFDYNTQIDYVQKYVDRRGREHEYPFGMSSPHDVLSFKSEWNKNQEDYQTMLRVIGLSTDAEGNLDTSKVFDEYNKWAKSIKKSLGYGDYDSEAAFGSLSDIISSMTLDGCGESLLHGGHSASYWSTGERIYAENWADFCYLKSTQRIEMLDLLKEIAPNKYNALEEVYELFWTTKK